jgi:hypothetical protein
MAATLESPRLEGKGGSEAEASSPSDEATKAFREKTSSA